MATEAVVTDTQGAASAGVNGVAAAQDAGGLVFHPLEQFIVVTGGLGSCLLEDGIYVALQAGRG